jgi:hypothetical protein
LSWPVCDNTIYFVLTDDDHACLLPFILYRGPGFRISDFESNRIIGEAQFQGAQNVMNNGFLNPVQGRVKSVHAYVTMYVFV